MHNIIQYTILSLLFFLIPVSLSVGFTVSKYAVYPAIGFLLLYNLFVDRRDMVQVLVVFFIGIIAQRIYMYNFGIGPIVIEAAVIFVLAKYLANQVSGVSILRTNMGAKLFISSYVCLALISSATSISLGVDPLTEFMSFQRYFLWSLLFLLYGLQIRQHGNYSQVDIERIFALLTICVCFLHMFAVFTETNLAFVRADGAAFKHGTYFRYGGVFSNPNVQGVFVVGGMMFSMFLYTRSRKLLDKAVGSSAFILGAVSNLISGSRMGMVLVPFVVILFLFYNRTQFSKVFSFAIGSVLSLMAIAAIKRHEIITFFNRSQKRIDAIKGANTTRDPIWSCSSDVIANNPLGMGINQDLFMQDITPCLGNTLANPHNLFLDFGVHLGWLGLVLFLLGFVFLSKRMWKFMFGSRRMVRDDASTYFALTAIFCYGLTEAFAFDLHKMHLVLFFVVGLALGGCSLPKSRMIGAPTPQKEKLQYSND